MAGLTLNAASCVRAVSKFSTCTRCEVICPVDAIVIPSESLPSLNLAACVGCGGCVGVCPSEALALDDFNSTNFFFDFAQESDNLISCKKNVPCISVLNVEHILSLAILKEDVVFDMGHCGECSIADKCQAEIEKNADECNYLLEAMEHKSRVKLEDISFVDIETISEEQDRRGFFQAINLKNIGKTKAEFDRKVEVATDELLEHTINNEQIAQIKQKSIPDKRKILFTALKRADKPELFHVIDASELSFTSTKIMDEETCTACQMCYRICPTGSLSSNMKNSKIDFDPFLCIKCALCHDVCEPKSITLSTSYNMKEFFEPRVQNLIKFSVKRCNECGLSFTSLKGARICHRCQIEEDEARTLWGIPDDM